MKKIIKNTVSKLGIIALSGLLLMGCGSSSYLERKSEVEAEEITETTDDASDDTALSDTDSSSEMWIVQVAGAVREPGIFEVAPGSRIYEAIELAGGITEDADDSDLNQAEPLSDGQKIYIYTEEEMRLLELEKSQQAEVDDGLVHINTASEAEFMTLPGIGESKAKSIVEYREKNGNFQTKEDLMNIPGIKEGVYNKIVDLISAE